MFVSLDQRLLDGGAADAPSWATPAQTPTSPRHTHRTASSRKATAKSEPAADDSASIDDIELPIDHEPVALPGGLQPRTFMTDAVHALVFRTEREERNFCRGWLSRPCEQLLIAVAWHTVCERFKPDAVLADRLFSTLAADHARLFTSRTVSGDAAVKDALAWYLPDALSVATVLALRSAFPKSAADFDDALQRKLFGTLVEWTSGFGGRGAQRARRRDVSPTAEPHFGTPRSPHGSPTSATPDRRQSHGRSLFHTGGGSSAGGSSSPRGSQRGSGRLNLEKLLGSPTAIDAPTSPVADRTTSFRRQATTAAFRRPDATDPLGNAGVGGGNGYTNAADGAGGRAGSARRSMLVGGLPPVRREKRDVSACSPLMARWLQLKQLEGEARGGSTSRGANRVRCSDSATETEHHEALVRQGANTTTFRDVRRDAARKSERLVSDYTASVHAAITDASTVRGNASFQMRAMRSEHHRVIEKGQTSEYANFLVAVRALHEEPDPVFANL